jgi:ribose transport system ATP-binding protein
VGARQEIYEALFELVSSGKRAAICTSSEPDELLQIAGRVIVLAGGRIAGILNADGAEERDLLHLAHKLEPSQEALQ